MTMRRKKEREKGRWALMKTVLELEKGVWYKGRSFLV
jgi:hypothetical protein